jgi:D-sedoheptulose 7-phosphate isomerase
MNIINQYLDEVRRISERINAEDIISLYNHVRGVKSAGGRLFVVGVGGSAANASHAVNDFRKICDIESYCVSDNVSELTARINDVSWESSYCDWLAGSRLNGKDAILVLSVGGGSSATSVNLCRAIDYGKSVGSKILSIVSRDGGYAIGRSDTCVLIPIVNESRITPHAEEWQGIIWHLIVTMFQELNYEN